MKANEYIKKYGIDEARKFLEVPSYSIDQLMMLKSGVDVREIERLVESHELVEIHGYEKSKEIVANAPSDDLCYSWRLGESGVYDKTVNVGELRKAIADVESCQ